MPKPRKKIKGKPLSPEDASRLEAIRKESKGFAVEQMAAIARHVPPADRWVANHPWMSGDSAPKDYVDHEDWMEKARRASLNCPGDSAINMLHFSLSHKDKFWAAYMRKVDAALTRWDRSKQAERKKRDTVENLEDIKKQLDKYLGERGLSRVAMPDPTWYQAPQQGVVS